MNVFTRGSGTKVTKLRRSTIRHGAMYMEIDSGVQAMVTILNGRYASR